MQFLMLWHFDHVWAKINYMKFLITWHQVDDIIWQYKNAWTLIKFGQMSVKIITVAYLSILSTCYAKRNQVETYSKVSIKRPVLLNEIFSKVSIKRPILFQKKSIVPLYLFTCLLSLLNVQVEKYNLLKKCGREFRDAFTLLC